MKNTLLFGKNENGNRVVLAATDGFYIYHPQCEPENNVKDPIWVSTRQTGCHKCGLSIYKMPKEG